MSLHSCETDMILTCSNIERILGRVRYLARHNTKGAAALEFPVTLLDLAGSVALLLWGIHMVQTGIQRAFGPNLRRALGAALSNRVKAFAAGIGVTAILQSSTATGFM